MEKINRRHFFKASTMGMIGAGLVPKGGRGQTSEKKNGRFPQIKDYRILGRTGFRVSDIGAGSIQDEGLLGTALDAGINYIDTAEQYPGHHSVVAKAIKGRARRSIFISSKLEVKDDTTKEGFVKRAHKCLEELETDYIDCMMMHMPEKVEILKTEGFHAAMQELKTEGRIRFVGVSNHGSFWFKDPEQTMEKVLSSAAEDGRFDVFLLAYNFLKMDQGERVLEACRERKIGTALMKTTPITIYYSLKTRVEQLEKEGKEIHPLYASGVERYKDKLNRAEGFIKEHNLQNPEEIKAAAVRFVLGNPNVNTVCCLPKTYDELQWFISLSGTTLSQADKTLLADYKSECGSLYCRHACGECEPACPQSVPINTIMRYQHYFSAQGREREAMEKYAAIPGTRAEACQSCRGECESACSHDVPVQGMLILAHKQLSLA